jgi:voltage-gated potassium channel
MFKDFGSENLIKDLCLALTGQIYLPQDYIILKDTIGAEMYFIVEGSVHVIATDKITVVKTLSKGDYFGEIAILFSSKRVAYV